ncbi:hypothetical protein [Chromobacterium haemolyticum]|uniref:hypothetical protein n=1 Tax=Chromobacterium haemolyticum TaxID=394935 RepID=UPI001132139F|nr:hypothetical protein [Chromobacterium haemolyticum]
MNAPMFQIGGLVCPLLSHLDFTQNYEQLASRVTLRSASGAGFRQTRWTRLKTSLQGGGWLPAGLSALDLSQPLELWCASPRAIASPAASIALPAHRQDMGVYGFAVLAGGETVETVVEVSGAVAILAPVPGVVGYQVSYWPVLTVFAELTETGDLAAGNFQWTLNCEEV